MDTASWSSAKTECVANAVLAAEQDCGRIVAAAEQVLGEVEPGPGKPLRARHPVAVDQYRSVAPLTDDFAPWSQSADQNAGRSSIDQRCSAA